MLVLSIHFNMMWIFMDIFLFQVEIGNYDSFYEMGVKFSPEQVNWCRIFLKCAL